MKGTNLHSIEDYRKEIERVRVLAETTADKRARRNWWKYLHRLQKEVFDWKRLSDEV